MSFLKSSNKKWTLTVAFVGLVSAVATTGMKSFQQTESYILQGASKGSMINMVNEMGGKVVHDFAVIPAISAELTEEQVSNIKNAQPLIRISSEDKNSANKTASLIWPKNGGGTKRPPKQEFASLIWPKNGGGTKTPPPPEFASLIWPKNGGGTKTPPPPEFASLIWPKNGGGTKTPPPPEFASLIWPKNGGGTKTPPPPEFASLIWPKNGGGTKRPPQPLPYC